MSTLFYITLEDMFTCLDLSAATGHHLGIAYTPKRLRALRRMMIYRIFEILDSRSRRAPEIESLVSHFVRSSTPAAFVVLNWDIVLERSFRRVHAGLPVDYLCDARDWNRPTLEQEPGGVVVCKMHGSSNWVYCENCKSLFYDVDLKLPLHNRVGLIKSDFRLFDQSFTDAVFDQAINVDPGQRQCPFCDNTVASHIATFSYRKSFRTSAYSAVWSSAERILSLANHWVFVGYSLPEADYEFKHLLKTAELQLRHKNRAHPRKIEVVYTGNDQTKTKYERFFGPSPVYHPGGLAGYAATF